MSSQRGLPSTRPVHPCVLNVFDGNYGAEYCTWAHITSKELPNLVTAQGSTLRIFALDPESGKLELVESFPNLAGQVCYLEKLISLDENDFDGLLIGFAGHPRLSICSLQPPTTSRARLLLANSLVDLTPALMDTSMGSMTPLEQDLMASLLDRGRDKTCAVILGGGVAVAAIHIQCTNSSWHASEPFLLPLGTLGTVAGASFQQSIAHGFGDILSCCFLDGYLEPTLVMLHANSQFGRAWSGRLGREGGEGYTRYGCQVTAVSVTVPHHQAAVLWSVTVPADAFSVQRTGRRGCLVLSVNSVCQITNAGRVSAALCTNGWARSSCPPNFQMEPNPWPLPKLAVALDGAQVAMVSDRLGFVVLRRGAIYLLQQLEDTWSMLPVGYTLGSAGQIASLLVMPLEETSLGKLLGRKKSANMRMGLLFAGSRLGDSSLLGYTLESSVTLMDAMQSGLKLNKGTIKEEGDQDEETTDDYDIILRREEEALYAFDEGKDGNNTNSTASVQGPDVIPPSDTESEEAATTSKRAKLARASVVRSITAIDALTAVGPLGPSCEGSLYGTKRESKSNLPGSESTVVAGGSALIMPCGYGSSGGLALVTSPGRDDRSILVEEDCLNVQSLFCLVNKGLILMGLSPNREGQAGINALRIENSSDKVQLNQVDIGAWCSSIDEAMEDSNASKNPYFVFTKTQLLAAVDLGINFGVIVRLLTEELSYAFVIYKDVDGALETISSQMLSTGFPSTLLQVSPFLHLNRYTMFGCVWSMGCAIIYTIGSDGHLKEETIDGHSSLVESEDDDEQIFYQCDRITAVDLFQAPGNLFKTVSKSNVTPNAELNGGHVLGVVDEEDRELYFESPEENEENTATFKPKERCRDSFLRDFDPDVGFVAVTRQNGALQIFQADNLGEPVWQAIGCGQGAMKLSPLDDVPPRTPRMHKVYAREIRFFLAGPSEGSPDYFFAVSNNLGDVQIYKINMGELVRVPLGLPTRSSKRQSEHHGKLRRKKILPTTAVDESVVDPKLFYHNQLSCFVGISGQNGLFAATARPMWYLTERRALVSLSHRSRHVAPAGGKARPVCGFCAGVSTTGKGTATGFMTLHERIGRVGSQRLTLFKGISNFFSPLGMMPGGGYFLEKIPMGVTVHRVQFIDDANVSTKEHPLYAILVSREVEEDQSHLNEDGLAPEERQRIKDEKEEANTKRQVEADLGGFDMEQEWVEEIEREDCFEVDTSLGGAPPIRKSNYSVWIVDAADNWNVVDSHELNEFEHGITMKIMYLTEINVDPGSHSAIGDDVGTDQLFLAVGTAIVDGDGEDVSAKGRVLLFQVQRQEAESIAAGAQIADLSLSYTKDILHGPVTSLSCLKTEGKSRLIIGAGSDVNVEQWGMNRLTQVGFFRATMQILDIKLFKNFIILSDSYDSLYFLVWRESDVSLTLLAKDYEPTPVYAAGLLSRGANMTFVCHDDRQNLQFFQYAPGDSAARGGNKLVSRADVHIGSQTVSLESHFCRSSILINSATPASTLAALKSQDSLYGRSDDDQRIGIHFGTCDGGFGTVIPLNEPDYWRLAALQSVLANALESDCALNPRAWRLYRRTARRGGCRNNDRRKGVIDGDLVIQYCDLPTSDQEDLASAIGSTVGTIIDNLLELRCASMVV